jgi:hypothetical protein
MANNAVLCIDNLTGAEVSFNGLSIGVGSVVSAWNDLSDPENTLRSCLTLTGNTDEPSGSVTAVTQYNSCYECFINNYTTVDLALCGGGISFAVALSNFGYVPTENESFFLEITSSRDGTFVGCFEVSSVAQNSKSDFESIDLGVVKFLATASFPDCDTCASGFTSGVEYKSCNVCWDGTGYTPTVVIVPHPTYTNQFGQTVTQLNAVAIGGFNGLNN